MSKYDCPSCYRTIAACRCPRFPIDGEEMKPAPKPKWVIEYVDGDYPSTVRWLAVPGGRLYQVATGSVDRYNQYSFTKTEMIWSQPVFVPGVEVNEQKPTA